jgi:hypothetical protein
MKHSLYVCFCSMQIFIKWVFDCFVTPNEQRGRRGHDRIVVWFIAPKTLNYLAFQSFDFERTWWRLLQKRVVRSKFDISLCNRCLSAPQLWVRIPFMARCTRYTLCDTICQWLTTGRWFSPGTPVSSTNKTGRHDIAEIFLKVALNNINPNEQYLSYNMKIRWDDNYVCFIVHQHTWLCLYNAHSMKQQSAG